MNAVGDKPWLRTAAAGVALIALVGGTAACGSGSGGSDGAAPTTDPPTSTTTVADGTDSTTTASTETTSAPTTTVAPGLPDASEAQHSAPSDGTGIALLKTVRVGQNAGFERIVFEFAGTSMPGYRVQWVDGPIVADGSGGPVDVAGEAFLEIVMEPASGVDLSAPQLTIVYDGPDRIPVAGQTELITDLVRTGDFEAVLSWAAGTTEKVPFRVLTLKSPTRIVVDLETPS
ncbi:hypothetical protein ACE2AJ_18905 [Aquihabitans daechungensis]|uniref:AMIN-like domain-containing (lipo)protein n=1 Tax=Aquihabitans daechungensis TaxID=1052257 RepID=UPI003BA11DB0